MVESGVLLFSLIQALPAFFLPYGILTGLLDLFGGVILLILGVAIIILIVAATIVLLSTILVGSLVYLLTASFFYAGIAFLVVAVIGVVAMAGDSRCSMCAQIERYFSPARNLSAMTKSVM